MELAVELISRMLRLRPEERPTMGEVMSDRFFVDEVGADGGGESKGGSEAAAGGVSSTVESECVVCMDGENTHMFTPCGHKCVCTGCADLIMGGTAECPNCRAKVEGVIKVFG